MRSGYWALTDRQNHHIEMFRGHFARDIHAPQNKIAAGGISLHRVNSTPFEPNAMRIFSLVPVALKRFSKGAHVHVKNGRF